MSSLVASDDANTAFVGAHNPDDRLHVVFYTRTMPNEFETQKQGRPIFYECDFVKVHLPGNQLNNIDTFVNDSHKARFPRQWAHYMNNKKADSELVMGTPVTEWPLISRAVAEELRHLGFRTVESIAQASDTQLQSIGMRAGMQPFAFRERAARFLQVASSEAATNADAQEKQALREENAATKQSLQELQERLAAMEAKKPGRKAKAEA